MNEVVETPRPTGKCIACGDELLPDGTCGSCGSSQAKDFCKTCGKAMPANARRCNACNSYKAWRWLPIATNIASISGGTVLVGSAVVSVVLYFSGSCSNTHFKVGRSDVAKPGQEAPIYVKVWNTGRNPSTLVGYHLVFDNSPGKETTLALPPSDSTEAKDVIASGPPVVLQLMTPPDYELPLSLHDRQNKDTEVSTLTDWQHTQPMTLIIDVQESYDCSGKFQRRREQFQSGRIATFIASRFHLSLEEQDEKK